MNTLLGKDNQIILHLLDETMKHKYGYEMQP